MTDSVLGEAVPHGAPVLQLPPDFPAHLTSRSPLAFTHRLAEHDALELEAIARLAEELGAESVTCEDAVKPLVVAEDPTEPAHARRAAELIRNLDTSDSWMTLLNIEQVSRYRELVDEQVDAIALGCGLRPRSLRRRSGFVFASSPGSVTPAHFDIEQSILIQLRGNRTLSFGAFADQAAREQEVHRYWNGSFGRLASMPAQGAQFAIGPGDGVFIPPYTPHWLTNGDAPSLSLTLTFFTRSNEDESLVQAFNEKLIKLGRSPRAPGTSPVQDGVKARIMRTYAGARRVVRPERSRAR